MLIFRRPFLIAGIIYLLSAAFVFPFVRWYADNPDTFQYLSIAEKYISGDFHHAVNGYWSPLISWLLAVPLFFIHDDILAFKFLQIFIALFVLKQWIDFLSKTTFSATFKLIFSISVIPFLLDYSILNLTPDLLFTGILLLIINLLIDNPFFQERKPNIKIGIAGGLLFLTKSFGFPLFIFLLSILYLTGNTGNSHSSNSRNNFLKTGSVFCAICLTWIILLSIHYNEFTISKAAQFNRSVDVAPLPDRGNELPVLGHGLYAPAQNNLSAWESPGDYVNPSTINIFDSPKGYFQIIKRNFLSIYYFDFRRQTGIVFIVLFLLFLLFNGIKKLLTERWVIISLITIFLIYIGYGLILFNARYSLTCTLLMLILSVHFLNAILNSGKLKPMLIVFISAILILSVKRPLKEILFTSDKSISSEKLFSSLKHPLQTLWNSYCSDIDLHLSVNSIHEKKIISGNVASLKLHDSERDSYTNALRIAIHEKCSYFGQLDETLSYSNQLAELKKMNIDYLITLKNTTWGNASPVFSDGQSGISIYKVKMIR